MKLDERLVQAAKDFIEVRFPGGGEDGASAMYTSEGEILLSTAPEVFNDCASLCHETGAICEAYTKGKTITASVCVAREENGSYVILTPCGVCQERLFFWGEDVEVAVPSSEDTSKWKTAKLKEVQPYYWAKPFINP